MTHSILNREGSRAYLLSKSGARCEEPKEQRMIQQRTLKSSVTVSGVGIHSGRPANLTLHPALSNTGILFKRADLRDAPSIPAHFKYVVNTQMATTLGIGKVTIGTVEHVLAALAGLGIDNCLIEVDGPEVPIMDGSSRAFCEAIRIAGIQVQRKARPYLHLRRRVEIKVAEKWAVAEPSARLEIQASIDWDHPSIGYQELHYAEGRNDFSEIAGARTFGFVRDYEMLKKMGLARGGSLDNAVVLDDALVLNPDGLRYPDEFVRHKVLDALGDFKLAGISIHAFIRLHRAGHDLHSQLLAEIFKNADNYEIIDGNEQDELQVSGLRAALAY